MTGFVGQKEGSSKNWPINEQGTTNIMKEELNPDLT